MDECVGVQRVHLSTAQFTYGACQFAIINFHDLRDAQTALVQWHGRRHWGTRVEAHFMLPCEPVRHRTPCLSLNSQGSLRIEVQPKSTPLDLAAFASWLREQLGEFGELRSFTQVEEASRHGLLVAFVEFFDGRDRIKACTELSEARFDGFTIDVQFAWDQSSVHVSPFLTFV
ncbi:hypothetical protein H9P43_002025 [Blastocladiella emersonii ATCC 22665]|nr:hypothetical protein H9P43_002025 [Blastocladiella emersonii ATCC 22665]